MRHAVPRAILLADGVDSDVQDARQSDLPPLDWLRGGEPRDARQLPIKALMQAVLEDGIRSYLARDQRIRTEAEYWVSSPNGRSPFAFRTVCETLGLEPDAVRGTLERLREKNRSAPQSLGRIRANVRRTGRLLPHKAG